MADRFETDEEREEQAAARERRAFWFLTVLVVFGTAVTASVAYLA